MTHLYHAPIVDHPGTSLAAQAIIPKTQLIAISARWVASG